MVRGRQQDPEARPSRQLEISRAFRQRRAQELHELREQIARLEHDKRQLRADNEALQTQLQLRQQQQLQLESVLQQTAVQHRRLSDQHGMHVAAAAAAAAAATTPQQPCRRCVVLQAELEQARQQSTSSSSCYVCEKAETIVKNEGGGSELEELVKHANEDRQAGDTHAAAGPSSSSSTASSTTMMAAFAPAFQPPPLPNPVADTTIMRMWEASIRGDGVVQSTSDGGGGGGGDDSTYFGFDEGGHWHINPAVRRLM